MITDTTTHARPSGCPLPTAGDAEVKKPASPATIARMPSSSLRPTVRWKPATRMTTRKISSVVTTGWTTLSWPTRSADACSTNMPSIRPNPISQPRLRSAWVISRGLRLEPAGADSSATR